MLVFSYHNKNETDLIKVHKGEEEFIDYTEKIEDGVRQWTNSILKDQK